MQVVVPGELGAVVEGDGLAPGGRQRGQQVGQGLRDGSGGLAGRPDGQQQARVALVQGQDRLAIEPKQHQVRLPVPGAGAGRRGGWALAERPAVRHERGRTQGLAATPATYRPALGQEVPPAVVLRAPDLGVDKPIDRLVRNDAATSVAGHPPGHLFRRPALLETGQHARPQRRIPIQPRSAYRGWYRSVRDPLRFNSRAIVDGARFRPVALWGIESPPASRRATSHRSSIVRWV